MIEIVFKAENFGQLRTDIQEFAVAHLGFKFNNTAGLSQTTFAPTVDSILAPPSNTTIEKPGKRKPGRPAGWTKAGAEAAKNQTGPAQSISTTLVPEVVSNQMEFVTSTVSPSVTYEDCVKSLKQVWDKFGLPKAMECLNKFNVDHAKKLTPAQWPEFVSACNDAVK